MPFSTEALETLELNLSDLVDLTEEQQKKKIRKQWTNLCLEYHPDRKPGFRKEFDAVMAAYKTLTQANDDHYQHEIMQFFTPENIDIPYAAFDLTQQEGILTTYDHLLLEFSRLRTTQAKTAFAQYYTPFLNLARSLEGKQEKLNENRVSSLFKQMQEPLANLLKREWRILILRLYAEEFLDDFQYRHAIATGNLYPILATAKLLSPIKLIVAVINSLILVAICSVHYVFQSGIQAIAIEFMSQYGRPEKTVLEMLKLAVKIVLFLGIIALPGYFAPVLTTYAFALPLIAKILELLASPVNQGIRPLAARLNCDPVMLTAVTAVVGALALGLGFMQATTLASSALFVLPFVIVALYLHLLYNLIKIIKNIYAVSPPLAIFQIILLVGSIVLAVLIAPETPPDVTPVSILGGFLMLLATCSLLEIANYKLENMSATAAEMIETLPLPDEGSAIDPSLQQASLLGYKTATWSHRLFNTPKNADYLRPEDRTSQQQWSSFFGGGAKPAPEGVARFEDVNQPLLLVS